MKICEIKIELRLSKETGVWKWIWFYVSEVDLEVILI